jgi:hypothetical protein
MIEIGKFKCLTCDGSGWLPPISGKKEDGARHCPECNNYKCHTCSGDGKRSDENKMCWECNGIEAVI